MEKTKKIICPQCGRITEKRELIFLSDVIEGKIKEIYKEINGENINGVEYCSICR